MDTVDCLVSILLERAVCHHSILGSVICVVDRDDHWVVVLNRLAKFKSRKVVGIEEDLSFLNLLVGASAYLQVCNVILTVRRVEHLRRVVRVLFLCDAHVDTDVSVAQGIVLECNIQLVVCINLSLNRLFVQSNLDVEVLQVFVSCCCFSCICSPVLLVDGLAPRAVHLVVLLGALSLLSTIIHVRSLIHLLLLHLHHLHLLHIRHLRVTLNHGRLLGLVLLRLGFLALLGRLLLLLLVILATVLVVICLLRRTRWS